MSAVKEERDRILQLVENGQLNAVEAAALLDVFEEEERIRARELERLRPRRERVVRFRVTQQDALRKPHRNIVAVMPVKVVLTGLRLGLQLVPQMDAHAAEDLLRGLEEGASGRLLDLQDLEKGERFEVFVE
ncbi:hypothetical protein EI42_03922 [Thermosporothrix hazakensis]|jgi:hypothetical protein|uniref:YvlB/LiaX N-terminal domain-containing protein n=1 Tax=Thermosporothrix hazakensis TaxID=644383 RepID=A0A326U4Q3_THEHA|nr:hypothetical protein [Thermosporothrix hazakensis]PZW26342.1 hypothetical protein EI42_03922 [Thermosporothrix hazakensis]GCE48707.1 hypothetical protein KTH_35760 [Thermosporothrix hazakensis]